MALCADVPSGQRQWVQNSDCLSSTERSTTALSSTPYIPCMWSDLFHYMLFALQVQTLYYLGSAGNGRRKRSAAAAAQGAAVLDASTAEPEATDEPTGKKGGKRSKRRKKAAAGKENSVPPEDAGAAKESSPPAPDEEVRAYALDFGWYFRLLHATNGGMAYINADNLSSMRLLIGLCVGLQDDAVPDGEVVLAVANKSPLQDSFKFQRISGGLAR